MFKMVLKVIVKKIIKFQWPKSPEMVSKCGYLCMAYYEPGLSPEGRDCDRTSSYPAPRSPAPFAGQSWNSLQCQAGKKLFQCQPDTYRSVSTMLKDSMVSNNFFFLYFTLVWKSATQKKLASKKWRVEEIPVNRTDSLDYQIFYPQMKKKGVKVT